MKPSWRQIFVASLLVLTLSLPMPFSKGDERQAAFTDLTSQNPHFAAINYLYQNGIVEGYPDNTFRPDQPVNRAEALKIILLGSQIFIPEIQAQEVFPDVLHDAWYARYVLKAKNLAIVKGDDATGFFRPGDTVNLAEALKMALSTNGISPDLVERDPYSDVPQDAWFAPYFAYGKSHALLETAAREAILPGQPVDRGLLAELIYRLKAKPAATVDNYASFYGDRFHGRGTASGEVYDQNKFTAAHRTYPFNTYLKVTNAENDKSVIVKINDRGPYAGKNRVIDLSKAAFEAIAPLSRGVIPVKIEEVPAEEKPHSTSDLDAKIFKADIFSSGPVCKDPAAIKTLSKESFESIQLDHELPDTLLENEILKVTGQVVIPTPQVTLFLIDEKNEQHSFIADVKGGRFSVEAHLPGTGKFKLGLIPGIEGAAVIRPIEVLQPNCIKERVDSEKNPIAHAEINTKQGESFLSWNANDYNLFKVSFQQKGQLKSYILKELNPWTPPYPDFKDFQEGQVQLIIRGSQLNSAGVMLSKEIVWSQPYVLSFFATRHFQYLLDPQKIELVELSPFTAVRQPIKASLRPKVTLRQEAAVIAPQGPVETIALASLQATPKTNDKGIETFDPGPYTLNLAYPVKDIGTHFLEVNDVGGLAALNVPLYAKNQYPLLPDQADLTQRRFKDLGTQLDLLQTEMLNLVNRDRATFGLSAVALDSNLSTLAQFRANDMVAKHYFGHWDDLGMGADDLKGTYGIQTALSENLAKDIDLDTAQYGLMRSAIHRLNILGEEWTRLGVGIAKDTDGTYIMVQLFSPDPLDLTQIPALRQNLLQALNAKRENPLTGADSLDLIGQEWSQSMVRQDFFGWDDPQGNNLVSRVRELEATKALGTYIVAHSTFAEAIEQIVANPQLRQNEWQFIGIGIAQDKVGVIKVTLIYTE